MVVRYAQVVIGAPGSGKTTYCAAMQTILKELGRKVSLINIDAANEAAPYTADVDITELIKVDEIMETKGLGPNGALTYSIEFLEQNLSWLLQKLNNLENYLIMDFPGQIELYTHHSSVKNILSIFQKNDIRLCSVYLVDSHYTNDPGKYISALIMALNSMIQLEVATVNVLSKVDIAGRYGEKMEFGLDYYTEVLDLDYIVQSLDKGPLTKRYHKLNKCLADVVTDYSLVGFIPLSVENRSTLINVMKAVDKANGYVFGTDEERNIQRLLSTAVGAEWDHQRFGSARDMYTSHTDEMDGEEEILQMVATQNSDRV